MSLESTPQEWQRYEPKQRRRRFLGLFAALMVFVLAWNQLDVAWVYVWDAHVQAADIFGRMFPPDVAATPELVDPLLESVQIAVLGTVFSVLMSVPVAYLAAENTAPNRPLNVVGKLIVTLARSVDVIIWVLVLVILFGPGAVVSIIAISFRSVGFIGKLLAEAIEELDRTQVEAVAGTGAGRIETVVYGVIPQITPAAISIITFRWDSNVRTSTIVGLVGGGGIGASLSSALTLYQWDLILMILVIVLGVVVFSEWLSATLREKIR